MIAGPNGAGKATKDALKIENMLTWNQMREIADG